jgi:drug/metabolite transporter (DMT)-like permease
MHLVKKYRPYLALAFGVSALSMSSLFIRWADAPGVVTSFYRMLFAVLFLTPVYLRRSRREFKWKWSLLVFPIAGGLFTALDHALWSTSIGLTKVANATLLNNIAPLWVALVAILFYKEKLGWKLWVGLILTLGGAGVVLGNDLVMNPHLSKGDLIAIVSSIFYAGYFLVTQRGRRNFDTLTYIFFVDIVCALALLTINLGMGNPLGGYSATTFLVFVASALISQIIGYFSITYALGHLPAAIVSPTMIAQPVLTALLAIPLIGEALMPGQWIGGLTVLAGIYLVNRSQPA